MTGNPAAPRTEAAGTAPVPYDRGIDPAPYGIPRPASAGRRGRIRLPLPDLPHGRKPDVSGPSRIPWPGTGGPGHASNGTARRHAAAQWFFFFAGRPGPWIISASRNPSNPPRTVPRARGVAFDGTLSRPITLRLTNRPKRKNQGRNRIPVKRKEQEMFGFLNLLTPDDRAELIGNILLLIVIAISTTVVNAGRIRRRITRTWRILRKGTSATRTIIGRAGIR